MRVVHEHGYSTNRTARGLSAGRTGLVGVTVPLIHPSYFSVILAGVGEALYEHDMRIVLCPTHHEHDREVTLLERLMQGTTDGALLILPEESHEELPALTSTAIRSWSSTRASRRRARADRVGRPLLRRQPGGRAPGRARPPADRRDHRAARAGSPPRSACAATRAASPPPGSCPTPQLVVESNFHVEGRARRRSSRCWSAPIRPPRSSPSTTSWRSASCRPPASAGCACPSDLSIVGFDDTVEARVVTPALTTVRQPLAEMGRMAVSLLVRLLEDQRIEALHVELQTKLVVRESTGPAPG